MAPPLLRDRLFRTLLLLILVEGPLREPDYAMASDSDREYENQADLPPHLRFGPAPVLSPEESLDHFEIAPGFRIELVAAEPLIEDPVALDFDESGRLWVAEMRGFMQDIDATGQFDPVGRIAVLEDLDGDGRMDQRTTYLEGLVLPRSLRCYRGGLLVAEHDRLWFTRDTDGDLVADEKELIDPEYATHGSVEHRPNGLLIGLDNWIYNAKSPKRYRYRNGEWVIDRTENRGQWGITQDDTGRLFYNFNWSQLHCDLAPPNSLTRNRNSRPTLSVNAAVTRDQRVYPIRKNTAVNRGYRPGVLDEEGRLKEFASACSPWIYRGGRFPEDFAGNAFVCAPGANTIKRNRVEVSGLSVTASNGDSDRDFLASRDERFRPVALSGGPDGALYVVDMYRGIIQQSEFMTTFLRRESERRNLEHPIHLGRIYRIVPGEERPPATPVDFAQGDLIDLLENENGWIRDRAQQRLIFDNRNDAAPRLLKVATAAEFPASLHALWTLEALGRVDFEPCLKLAAHPDARIAATALQVVLPLVDSSSASQTQKVMAIIDHARGLSLSHTFHGLVALGSLDHPDAQAAFFSLAASASYSPSLREATISGLEGRERRFLDHLESLPPEKRGGYPGLPALAQMVVASLARSDDEEGIEATLASLSVESFSLRESYREGLLAGLMEREEPPHLTTEPKRSDPQFRTLLIWPGHDPEDSGSPVRPLNRSEKRQFAQGQRLYASLCSSCHGIDGRGLVPVAPPLRNSDWVLGSPESLTKILLHGIEGPIEVNGRAYRAPEILPAMPPVGMQSDREIAEILTYVRRAWGHTADPISPQEVRKVRDLNVGRESAWTAPELKETTPPAH